ncbi:MAG: molybdopterin cofactor-binding domain-containing protein [Candidatus Kapaibacteriota bacterium]
MEEQFIESRRRFIFGSALTFAGILSGFPSVNKALSELVIYGKENKVMSFTPSVWVEITKDNFVVVTVARSEIGQGVKTTFAMIVAEELDADWSKVVAVNAEGDEKYGDQLTGGSTSVREFWTPLRQAGAQARLMLIQAAAKIWGIDPENCYTENSFVFEKNGARKLSYGELIDTAIGLPVPPVNQVKLKSVAEFKILGKPTKNLEEPNIVKGKIIYGLDYRVPGMKYAVLLRCPYIGGSLINFDATDALKVNGVVGVYQISEGIAVVADNSWVALKARDLLKVQWDPGPNAQLSTDQIFERFRKSIVNLKELPKNTVKEIQVVYEVPFLAHSTMEPMNAFANYKEGKCEIYAGTQNPQVARIRVASALQIPKENVKVFVLNSGGGFGRRLEVDYIVIAAKISKLCGCPVLFFFTKSDDIKFDYYRPASVHGIRAGIDKDGKPTGLRHKIVWQSNSLPLSPHYDIPDVQNSNESIWFGINEGAWRSVAYSQNNFAMESAVDELAYLAGRDPFQYRYELTNDQRLKRVLSRVAENANWGGGLPKGWGRGIAAFVGYGAYIAHVVEVSVSEEGFLKVQKIYAVVDPGFPINTENIKNQIRGAAIDALSTALYAEITIQDGQIQQSGFHNFRWLRMDEVPDFDIEILTTSDRPSGMGEVGFPSVSPALCNAIFNATGIRIRKLPVAKTPLTLGDNSNVQEKSFELIAYPNPFETDVKIEIIPKMEFRNHLNVMIYDFLGKKVFQPKMKFDGIKYFVELNFENFPSAVYYVVILQGNEKISFPILKKR